MRKLTSKLWEIKIKLLTKGLLLRHAYIALLLVFSLHAFARSTPNGPNTEISRTDKSVAITKVPHDQDISNRLQRILTVTGWFKNLKVTCDQGVVVLHGLAQKSDQSQWAEALAKNTDEVVAVINDMQVENKRWFDLAPAQSETEGLAKRAVAFLPYLITSILIFLFFCFLGALISRVARRAAENRVNNVLMVELVSRVASLPVYLIGLYLVLQVCGLTGVAATILGGTGALGLIAGFAMQNILANYFAGIMLSVRNPYTTGDVITVAGQTGVVQKLTTRGTILVDFDGNHIIIPNSTIYQNIIINRSSNPKARVTFSIGISYNDLVAKARITILQILNTTEGVLKDPEPLVMASEFLERSVKINVLFWISTATTSGDKLKSVILERVKETLQNQGYTLPGELQQFALPTGFPTVGEKVQPMRIREAAHTVDEKPVEIKNEKDKLLEEASQGRDLDQGRDLSKS